MWGLLPASLLRLLSCINLAVLIFQLCRGLLRLRVLLLLLLFLLKLQLLLPMQLLLPLQLLLPPPPSLHELLNVRAVRRVKLLNEPNADQHGKRNLDLAEQLGRHAWSARQV